MITFIVKKIQNNLERVITKAKKVASETKEKKGTKK